MASGLENIETIESPFRRFVTTIGVFPTAFTDAMTYYECLAYLVKYLEDTVIPAVNDNAEALEELQGLFVELKSYVDNYFANLDVQTEINKKLDQMAEDGSLYAMIERFVTPYLDEQGREIASLNQRITTLASGSPLVASSTDDMTETDRVYVNTTDGKWYYYDGEAWQEGGQYQASVVAEGSVTYNSLDNELKADLISEPSVPTITSTTKTFMDTTGTTATLANSVLYELDVTGLDKYYIDVYYLTSYFGNSGCVFLFKDTNDDVISFKKANELVIDDNNHIKMQIEVPVNGVKLYVNSYQVPSATGLKVNPTSFFKIEKYVPSKIEKDQLSEAMQGIFTEQYTTVEPSLFITGAYIATNEIVAYNGYNVYTLNVNPREKYTITSTQLYGNPILYFGNPASSNTYTIGGNEYTAESINGYIKSDTSGYSFEDYEFTIPDFCHKIYMSATGTSALTIKKCTSYKVDGTNVDLTTLENVINPLNNKTILFVGDSITAATTAGVKGWTGIIAENNPNATVYNYGQDGATLAVRSGNTNDVVTKIQTMYSEHSNADYVIIQGGVNDLWNEIPLGTFNATGNFNGDTPYDTSTFSGALEWILHYALTNFDGKKVGFIVTQKIWHAQGFEDYMNRAKDICKKWSIPFIDLYTEGDLNYMITSQRSSYSITTVNPEGDGCHPNLAGYTVLSPKIEKWLKYSI